MSYPIHPDDVPSPRFGTWADDFNTYREACAYYGAEDPDCLAYESQVEWYEDWDRHMDLMEATGGSIYSIRYEDNEIPF